MLTLVIFFQKATTTNHEIAKESPEDKEDVIDVDGVNENADTQGPGQVTK